MTDETPDPRIFPALRLLERKAPPMLYGKEAYFHAPIPLPAEENPLVPSWTWHRLGETPSDAETITVDTNGAFLGALGGVDHIAHSELKHLGALDPYRITPRQVWPGYYKITVFHWAFGATLVSPLGDNARLEHEHEVWIAHPTLVLLLELLDEGSIGGFAITDSWVSERKTNFRAWSAALRPVRTSLLDQRDRAETDEQMEAFKARYKAFKEGYGSAFAMMLTGRSSRTRRPDWAHAVYAQHAATAWRRAWKFTALGPVFSVSNTDEMVVLREDLAKAVQMEKPFIRLDPTGRHLGHVKEKQPEEATEPVNPYPDMIMADGYEDIL